MNCKVEDLVVEYLDIYQQARTLSGQTTNTVGRVLLGKLSSFVKQVYGVFDIIKYPRI